jgi:dTDP-4-dehydrorhamnose 3,5-epimerase
VIFEPVSVDGVFIVQPEPITDERGYFARVFCADEFVAHGLTANVAQCSISFNPSKGTLRGLHYADPPEEKLVRCTRGRIFDVVVDVRPESPSYRRWTSAELSADNAHAFYVPAGVAHGFYTLEDDCEVLYQISTRYDADAARGVRWDDPAFGIDWPGAPTLISERDRSYQVTQ